MRKSILGALALLSLSAVAGERLTGANIDTRTTLAFKVKDAAVSKLLPEGWAASPSASGPNRGANLTVILIDSQFASDAAGKSLPPFRGMVLAVPAKKAGTDSVANMVVFGIAPEAEVPGPYSVYSAGTTIVGRSSSVSADGSTSIQEKWIVSSKPGDSLEFSIQFQRGLAARLKSEARPRSGVRPDFYRIYHLDQTPDVVKSTAANVNRAGSVAFQARGPRFGDLFDGSEELISITSTPIYSRTVYLPE